MATIRDDPFTSALAALLAPLARAMVARSVSVQDATEALKRALLQAALDQDGADASDSRVSLQTGLHRKDVKRLRNTPDQRSARRAVNAVALAISYWSTGPEFQTTAGRTRDLPRTGDADHPGFDDLIRRTRVDLAPGTVLRAMIDQGIVEETDDGAYRLLTHMLMPSAGSAAQVAAYEATLSAHLAVATNNLLAEAGTERQFDRVVRYSHLSAESVDALAEASRAKAQALLEEINAMAREMQEQDTGTNPTGRFAFGAYVLPSPPRNGDGE